MHKKVKTIIDNLGLCGCCWRDGYLTYVAVVGVLVAIGLAFGEGFGYGKPEVGAPRGVDAVEIVFSAVDSFDFPFVGWANGLGTTSVG